MLNYYIVGGFATDEADDLAALSGAHFFALCCSPTQQKPISCQS
jgi:hypothetical protein